MKIRRLLLAEAGIRLTRPAGDHGRAHATGRCHETSIESRPGGVVSIFDQTDESGAAASRDRSLELFTNRVELARRFAGYLNDDPAPRRILFLHGMGGNGKSLLLRHLETRCSVRLSPDQWREVRGYPDEAFGEALRLAPSATPVPVARLNFDAKPVGENRPQESFSALFMLKRQLGRFKVAFPRFDFAAVTYLHRSGLDFSKRLAELFGRAELGIAADLAGLLTGLPVLKTGVDLLQVIDRRLDDLSARRHYQRRVPTSLAHEILSLPAEPDLANELPRYFAQDLNDALAPADRYPRVVLLFDTHEAFWGEERARAPTVLPAGHSARDEWLRRLLGHLDLAGGIVAVVAGRTLPQWDTAAPARIPAEFLDAQPVGPLAPADAEDYLRHAGVQAAELRAAMLAYATVGAGEIHPYFLGLCADVALAASQRGATLEPDAFPKTRALADKERELTGRLLAWVTPATEHSIIALSACRAFTYATFSYLADPLGFGGQRVDFDRLVAFSFIAPVTSTPTPGSGEPPPGQSQAFAMHQLLRRLLRGTDPDATRRAHQLLRDHHASHAGEDFAGRVEAIYHTNQIDPPVGVVAWTATMDECLGVSRYERCRALLSLLPDLTITSDADRQACLTRVVRAELGLGRWADAEQLLTAELPADDPEVQLLWSELWFVRGDFDQAAVRARRALTPAGHGRVDALIRLADIHLYLGKLPTAARYAQQALQAARAGGSARDHARCLGIVGATLFFSGQITQAEQHFTQALQTLQGTREDPDRVILTILLGNLGQAKEALADWAGAEGHHREALARRREAADARGSLQSLHALARVLLGQGQLDAAEDQLQAALRLAVDLGDQLEQAKLSHSHANLALRRGDPSAARRHATDALRGFADYGTSYDVAHATLSLSEIAHAAGDEQAAVRQRAAARQVVDSHGFGLLTYLFPALQPGAAERIAAGLLAYALGDAFGLPWEGTPPAHIDVAAAERLPARPGWPRGATSDDTALTLLVAEHLVHHQGAGSPLELMRAFAEHAPGIRGLGPTTTQAIRRFQQHGTIQPDDGNTNGAVMRALPIGWATPLNQADSRRQLTLQLSQITHPGAEAACAACIMAACASWAVEGASPSLLLEVARTEAPLAVQACGADPRILSDLGQVAAGEWTVGPDGVRPHPYHTLTAVLHCLQATALPDALRAAVALGGDTDTVAALVAGLLGVHHTPQQVRTQLPWSRQVHTPPNAQLHQLAAGLAGLRAGVADG
jgi:ADP-ribosylglycohydrolase/tetratricopeptide (TPR) repeat protein